MTKLISGLIAAVMTAAGLVAFSGSTAQADPPYPGTVPTYCSASSMHPTKVHNKPRVRFRAWTAGNGVPRGTVRFRVWRKGNVVRTSYRWYHGPGVQRYRLARLHRPGRYRVVARINPRNDKYQNCSHSFPHRVKRRG